MLSLVPADVAICCTRWGDQVVRIWVSSGPIIMSYVNFTQVLRTFGLSGWECNQFVRKQKFQQTHNGNYGVWYWWGGRNVICWIMSLCWIWSPPRCGPVASPCLSLGSSGETLSWSPPLPAGFVSADVFLCPKISYVLWNFQRLIGAILWLSLAKKIRSKMTLESWLMIHGFLIRVYREIEYELWLVGWFMTCESLLEVEWVRSQALESENI